MGAVDNTLQKLMYIEDDEMQDSSNPVEEDTSLEDTGTEEDFSQVEDDDEEKAKLREQNKRLYARLKKVEAKTKEPKEEKPQEPKETPKEESNDELIRARLEVRGFLDSEEQDIIIKAAKALEKTPLEAAQDDIVMGRINKLREQKKTNNAVPPPGGRSGSKKAHSVDYYIEKGELPDDPELAEKVQAEMARRSKSGA